MTGEIIAAAIAVHTALGPGFLEAVYERALAIELKKRSIPFCRQHPIAIFYEGEQVGQHRLDFFVADEVVVELKTVKMFADEHFAVVRSYLHAAGRAHGLLLNFSKTTLQIKRVRANR